MNKVCDAADWFRPELDRTVREALEELPRCHRKQWEFAVLYRALELHGMLGPEREGISFGSGTERLLYSVARRVKHLWATDLYGDVTTWDTARTADAAAFVRGAAPFAIPDGTLSARRMDMREIAFPDASFDFAWSSCAIEHIGGTGDFLRHLREVHRVLKPGGIYALTTELTFLDAPVAQPGNHFFSRRELELLARQSGFEVSGGVVDARLTEHELNTPLPVEVASGLNDGEGRFGERLFGSLAHLHLANANVPFTSCVLTLRRAEGGASLNEPWRWEGFEGSARFVEAGLSRMRRLVEESSLPLHPFAALPERRSPHFAGHEAFFSREGRAAERDAVHTAYVWLGAKPRTVRVHLASRGGAGGTFTVRVQRLDVRHPPGRVETLWEGDVQLQGGQRTLELPINPRDDARYAIVARPKGSGRAPLLEEVTVTALPAGSQPRNELGEVSWPFDLRATLRDPIELPLTAARNLVRRLRAPLRGG